MARRRSRPAAPSASPSEQQAIVEAVEAAFALGHPATVEELLARIAPSRPARGRLPRGAGPAIPGAARTDAGGYVAAAEGFRALNLPFQLAVTLLEQGERLADQGRASEAEPLLAEATEIFERLAATPWVEWAPRLASSEAVRV